MDLALKNILLAFIPIFVAVDAVGVLPIFISLTEGVSRKERSRIIVQSMFTAILVAVGFVFLGQGIFKVLGITVGDFMVAGGSILFCIAIIDILNTDKRRRRPGRDLGSVPLGTPLIVGPAVMTTTLMIISEYGLYPTLISVVVNVLLAGLIFSSSEFILKLIGPSGARTLSKITSLLLAAIAIMMVRKGILQFLKI